MGLVDRTDNLVSEVDSAQEALYGSAMAGEQKSEHQRERTLFDKDREEFEDLAQLAIRAPWDERTRIDVVSLLTLFGEQRFGQDVVSSMMRKLGVLKDIIQESPLYELAREYGETRGLRHACLALTKAKAPRLVPVLEPHLGDSTDVAHLERLLVDLGLAQNEEAVQSAISRHFG